MLPMSNTDVKPGSSETQQLRVTAPVGVRSYLFSYVDFFIVIVQSNVRLRLRVSFTIDGRFVQDQVDFSGFPPDLTGGN